MSPVGKHCESVQVLLNHNASPRQEEELIQGLRESIGPLQVSTDMFDVHLAVVVKSTHVVDRIREVLRASGYTHVLADLQRLASSVSLFTLIHHRSRPWLSRQHTRSPRREGGSGEEVCRAISARRDCVLWDKLFSSHSFFL